MYIPHSLYIPHQAFQGVKSSGFTPKNTVDFFIVVISPSLNKFLSCFVDGCFFFPMTRDAFNVFMSHTFFWGGAVGD